MNQNQIRRTLVSLTPEDFQDLERKSRIWAIKYWGLAALMFVGGLLIGLAL